MTSLNFFWSLNPRSSQLRYLVTDEWVWKPMNLVFSGLIFYYFSNSACYLLWFLCLYWKGEKKVQDSISCQSGARCRKAKDSTCCARPEERHCMGSAGHAADRRKPAQGAPIWQNLVDFCFLCALKVDSYEDFDLPNVLGFY